MMKGSSPDPSTTSAAGLTNNTTPVAGDGTQLQAGAQPFRPPPPFSLTSESSAAPPQRYEPPSFGAAKRPGGASPPPPHPYSPGVPSYGSSSKANRSLNNGSGMMGGHMNSSSGNAPVQGKFKTEMCRNWELMGQCTYRGCTYAHGPDDLRQVPMSYDSYGRGNNNSNASGNARYQQAPMYQGGGDSNQGSTNTTPSGGPRQSSLSRSAPQPISASAPTVASEQIIDMILVEVRHERDDLLQQVNASKQLEADLRREQRRRQAVVRTQRALEGVLQMLKQDINERTRLLNDVLRAKGDYDFEAVLDDVMDSEEEAREHHRGMDSDEEDHEDYAACREDTNEFSDKPDHHHHHATHHHQGGHRHIAGGKAAGPSASNVWGNSGMATVTSSNTLGDFDLQALDDLIEGGSSASGSSTSPRGGRTTSSKGHQGRGSGAKGGAASSGNKATQNKTSAWGEPRGGRGGSGRGSGRGAAAPKRR